LSQSTGYRSCSAPTLAYSTGGFASGRCYLAMVARMTAKLIMNPVIIMNLDRARRSCPMMFPPLLRSGLSSVDRVPLAGRRTMLEATAAQDPAIPGTIGCLVVRLVVQRAESLDYVVEKDRSLPA